MASPHTATRRLILQKTRHGLLPRDILPVPGFRFSFTPLPGSFSPFPHGTSALSVAGRIQPWIVVDPDSDGVSRAPPYSGTVPWTAPAFRLRGSHPLRPAFPGRSAMRAPCSKSTGHPRTALQPRLKRFGLLPVRSPLLRESLLISFPGLLRWFTSPGSAPPHYFIHARGACLPACGLPHSAIRGSQDVCSSPRLFAAYRGLPRRPAPWHPPGTFLRLAISRPLPFFLLLPLAPFPRYVKDLPLLRTIGDYGT